MFEFVIEKIIEREGNECYNSNLSNNGGGYHQPVIEVSTMSGMRLVIYDASCGDFGGRVWMTLFFHDNVLADCEYNTMEDKYASTFRRDNSLHAAAYELASAAGYGGCFLFKEDIRDY